MGDKLIAKKIEQIGLEWWQEMGVSAGGFAGYPIETPISDGSDDFFKGAFLELKYAETLEDVFFIRGELAYAKYDSKLFPTSGPTVSSDANSKLIGAGRQRRFAYSISDSGSMDASASFTSTQMLGKSALTAKNPYGGEQSGESAYYFSTEAGLRGAINLGGRFELFAMPALSYGVRFSKDGSEFNNLFIELILYAGIEIAGESDKSSEGGDVQIGIAASVFEFYKMAHALLQRHYINSALSDPQAALEAYGIPMGGGDPSKNPLKIVPTFMAASTLLGGVSYSPDAILHSSLFWALTAAQGAGGMIFAAGDSEAGKSAGYADLVKTAWLLAHALAGTHTVDSRRGLGKKLAEQREQLASFGTAFAAVGLSMLGTAGGNELLASGASGGAIPVAMNPAQVTDSVARKRYAAGYAPKSGRAALSVHNSFLNMPTESLVFCTGVELLYGGSTKDIGVTTYAGTEWRSKYHYLFAAAAAESSFGPTGGTDAGVIAGLGLVVSDPVAIDVRAKFFDTSLTPTEYTLNLSIFW